MITLCYDKFGIQGKPVADCRLRVYDPQMQVRLGIFDEYGEALVTFNLNHSRSTLDLEFKDGHGNFEECDPSWVHLKAVAYEEEMTYDFAQPDSFPTKVVRINGRQDKVCDLEKQLSEMLEIPEAELIVLLRHEHGYNGTVSTEYYNMPWRRDKKIADVSKFTHGTVLYCERGKPDDHFDTRKWKQEFDSEGERISLSVNDVRSDPEANQFEVKVSLPRTSTVKQLKEIIGKRMQLSINEFYLVRSANDRVIKDINQSLTYTGLSNHSQIRIVLGKPEMEGSYKVTVSVVKILDACERDNQICETEPLGSLIISPESTGAAFKQQVRDLYNAERPDA